MFVTQRDGFLPAVLRFRDGSRIVVQIRLEDIEIDRYRREIRITDQPLQQGLTLRQYLLGQRFVEIDRCFDQFGYLCHGFFTSFLKIELRLGVREALNLPPLLYKRRRPPKYCSRDPIALVYGRSIGK